MMTALLKFGGTLFMNLVFYDFFRDQLRPRVRDRKRLFLILLLCAAALRVVNSFGSSLVNLIFGMPILAAQVLLIFKDDHRKEAFLLLIGEAMALFSELATSLFVAKIPLWQLLREELHYTQEVEEFAMGILSYILCWFVLHGLKICFLGTRYTMREHFPLSFFILPLSTALIYIGISFGNAGAVRARYCLKLGLIILPLADVLLFFVSEKSREQQLMEQQAVLQQRYYKHLEVENTCIKSQFYETRHPKSWLWDFKRAGYCGKIRRTALYRAKGGGASHNTDSSEILPAIKEFLLIQLKPVL